MNKQEILQRLNLNYCDIKSLIEDSGWGELIKKSESGEEMRSHVGDILHYLSELMGCVEEEI